VSCALRPLPIARVLEQGGGGFLTWADAELGEEGRDVVAICACVSPWRRLRRTTSRCPAMIEGGGADDPEEVGPRLTQGQTVAVALPEPHEDALDEASGHGRACPRACRHGGRGPRSACERGLREGGRRCLSRQLVARSGDG
jgi:hypothetical protein